MIVPGLPSAATAEGNFITIYADANDVSVSGLFGNPVSAIDVFVIVDHGVVIGSSQTIPLDGPPPASFLVDLPAGSIVRLTNFGRITGAGGTGGDGQVGENQFQGSTARGGGGGGGAGHLVGAGGLIGDDAITGTDGTDGTALLGGAAGTNGVAVLNNIVGVIHAIDGGDAIEVSSGVELIITNIDGEIFGGGGGGAPGRGQPTPGIAWAPGAGGAIATIGERGDVLPPDAAVPGPLAPGAPGYAVRGALADPLAFPPVAGITFLSGDADPETKGAVGP